MSLPADGDQPKLAPDQRNVDDPTRLRNLLANDRTLLAYIRTALSFAGIRFAVAKFGLPKMTHLAGYLGLSWSSSGCWSASSASPSIVPLCARSEWRQRCPRPRG